MRQRQISREELFALVWEKPTVEVAKDLAVSDVAVAKLCLRLQVPKPPRGYWARVQSGATPRRPPLSAFREELEARRKRDARCSRVGMPLSELQRKFLDRIFDELATAGGSMAAVRLVSGRIVEMPGDVAAAALILLQARHAQWLKEATVGARPSEGLRRSLGGLVEKLLVLARPQVIILEQLGNSRGGSVRGPLVVVRMPASLQQRIAELSHIVRERGLDYVVLRLSSSEHAWVATPVYLAEPFATADTRLCVSATELWATCTIMRPGYLGATDTEETVTTERLSLRGMMPIDLLPVREVTVGVALRRIRLRDHWPRLRALTEAEQVLDMLERSQCDLSSSVPDDRLAVADRILFGDSRPLFAARKAYDRVWDELERWREELHAEREEICYQMLGIQPGDVVMVAKAGNAVRIVLERGDLYLSDGRVMFTLHGCRFRKDGLPGKRSEVFFFDIEARERDR